MITPTVMNSKGGIALALVAVILALTIFAFYLVNVAQRDCNSNRDCPENSYCGVDYECHEFPQQIMVKKSNFLPAAIIVGISIIVGAFILRKRGKGAGENNKIEDGRKDYGS